MSEPACPKCGHELDPLGEQKWICRQPECQNYGIYGAPHPDANPDVYAPTFATCRVCGELHQPGVMQQWFDCYFGSPEGLDELESSYLFSSSGHANTICRLIDEVRRLHGWPMRFPPVD